MENILENFNLNITNVILGHNAEALLNVVQELDKAIPSDAVVNELCFLPNVVYHHNLFNLHFRGEMIAHKNAFVFTQSKEFLETMLKSEPTTVNIVSLDFNVVIVDYDKDKNLIFKTYTKAEAYNLMIEQEVDLRDININEEGFYDKN